MSGVSAEASNLRGDTCIYLYYVREEMKKALILFWAVAGVLMASPDARAQATWNYVRALTFPASDTAFVRPYFCTVTSTGRVYVLSSNLTDQAAHNAIYYADSNATTLTRMIDFYAVGDTGSTGNIGTLRGIASVGTDILVNASVAFARSAPNTVGTMYYYPAGDTAQRQHYGFYSVPTAAGHGTYHHGITLTKDTIGFAGISFGTSIRFYNFRYSLATPARGSWLNATYAQEPGGPASGGFDIIRDCAVHPTGNYDDSTRAWFTSRNSFSNTQQTGGIAIWTGGRQVTNPGGYRGTRVQDPFGLLSLGSSISYGITVDRNGILWVAGNDSTRRWVKGFDVSSGIFANEVAELPSSNSVVNPVPNGAPLINPVDVALTPSALQAYVPDATQKRVYVFRYGTTSVGEGGRVPAEFTLAQNYPNPFNPLTTISFTLPSTAQVRLVVTNMLGQDIATLVDERLDAGKHVRTFAADGIASGVYLYRLTTGNVTLSKKMIVMR